jgi:hypothetical protein
MRIMAKMKPVKEEAGFGRLQVIVPQALLARVDEARAQLRRDGVRVSYSSLIEIALEELLGARDLTAILRKRGASARRS